MIYLCRVIRYTKIHLLLSCTFGKDCTKSFKTPNKENKEVLDESRNKAYQYNREILREKKFDFLKHKKRR